MLSAELDPTLTSVLGLYAAEENIFGFDAISKRKWLERRFLLEPGFIEGAPEGLRAILSSIKDNNYDHSKPLTKLRNQLFISYKTLFKHLQQVNIQSTSSHSRIYLNKS